MNKRKVKIENNYNIDTEQMASLARVLFPLVYDYLRTGGGKEKNEKNTDDTKKCA